MTTHPLLRRHFASLLLISACFASLSAGCAGPAGQAGLSNAPSMINPRGPEDRGHDAVSNGPESCAPSGKPEDDPLPNRVPKCPEAPRPVSSNAPR